MTEFTKGNASVNFIGWIINSSECIQDHHAEDLQQWVIFLFYIFYPSLVWKKLLCHEDRQENKFLSVSDWNYLICYLKEVGRQNIISQKYLNCMYVLNEYRETVNSQPGTRAIFIFHCVWVFLEGCGIPICTLTEAVFMVSYLHKWNSFESHAVAYV